ncbi:unnamed protein product [Rotaria sp. Silwood1]|nr:unnamed protein product [Rotaria sp. Silwood1]
MISRFLSLFVLVNFFHITSMAKTCHGPYVSGSSIEQLHEDMHLVRPRPMNCGGLASCEFYLRPASALGTNGRIG